jgi:hypothetical protein
LCANIWSQMDSRIVIGRNLLMTTTLHFSKIPIYVSWLFKSNFWRKKILR